MPPTRDPQSAQIPQAAETEGDAGRRATAFLAATVAVIVLLVTLRAQEPVGAGIYYDDGAYLSLARSLATGDGYVYSNLPGAVPGVKYPPAYPFVLSLAWRAFSVYPENLGVLKTLSALFWSLAAGVTVLLFARGDRTRRLVTAAVTGFAFLTVPSMSIATVLMAEPMFLVLCLSALLLAQRRTGTLRLDRADTGVGTAVALGLACGLVFLTRSIGVSLVIAILLPLAIRRAWRAAGLVSLAALVPTVPWLLWSRSRAAAVPEYVTGQYGSYGAWLGRGGAGEGTTLTRSLAAHWDPLVETLQFVWVPRASGWALGVALLALAAAVLAGARSVWKRNPALAIFPFVYLGIVVAWPYEPYRFYYVILPLMTLLVLEGLWEAIPSVRRSLPRWGAPTGAIVVAAFAINALTYHVRGHAARSWSTPQRVPARAYAPLNAWILANTREDAVIASALDPYVHWQTGRRAVPAWRFLPTDYRGVDESPEMLASALDSAIVRFGAEYAALILGPNKAARTLAAFLELHPERARKVLETEGPAVGVIYRIAPPGTAPWGPGREHEPDEQ